MKIKNDVVIGVKFYHPLNEPDKVPAPGLYWYNPDKQYRFGDPVDTTKEDGQARNPLFEDSPGAFPGSNQFTGVGNTTPITNGIEIWNKADLTLGALPSAVIGTRSSTRSYTEQSLYATLGSLEARRNHIKNNLNAILNNGEWNLILAGAYSYAATSNPFSMDLPLRLQSFVFWLEMMTMAVSVDSNFDTERKFNLLNGDSSLSARDVARKAHHVLRGNDPVLGDDRSTWTFRRLGSLWEQHLHLITLNQLSMDDGGIALWMSTYRYNLYFDSGAT